MVKRIVGIVAVFIFTSFAWVILGATVAVRTNQQDGSLRDQVGQLWGSPQRQKAPVVCLLGEGPRVGVVQSVAPSDGIGPAGTPPPAAQYAPGQENRAVPAIANPVPDTRAVPGIANTSAGLMLATGVGSQEVPLESSRVDVSLALEHRQKGLLWYSTYHVLFNGTYRIANHTDTPRDFSVTFALPAEGAVYDNFQFTSKGKELADVRWASSAVCGTVRLAPGEERTIDIAYGSQGLESWAYDFGANVNQVKDFALTMHTDFDEVDFPQHSISPTSKTAAESGHGWDLRWEYSNLLSGVEIGMQMPQKLNPGPWVAEISFFAPVSLFFFLFVVFIFATMQRVDIHPMNYFFIGCGFFAFHLLITYLVDHISIHFAFGIASVVSLFLVISYMRLVVGQKFAIMQIGISQFVYLVLFSYTFFFEKYTGLAVTIMCVVTLFVVMQMTGRVNWAGLAQPEEVSSNA